MIGPATRRSQSERLTRCRPAQRSAPQPGAGLAVPSVPRSESSRSVHRHWARARQGRRRKCRAAGCQGPPRRAGHHLRESWRDHRCAGKSVALWSQAANRQVEPTVRPHGEEAERAAPRRGHRPRRGAEIEPPQLQAVDHGFASGSKVNRPERCQRRDVVPGSDQQALAQLSLLAGSIRPHPEKLRSVPSMKLSYQPPMWSAGTSRSA